MIGYGRTDKEFFCFTVDAPANGYQMLEVQLVKQKEDDKIVWKPEIKNLKGMAALVGKIHTETTTALGLVDFASYPPQVKKAKLKAGCHTFDLLNVELPLHASIQHQYLIVLPGTVIGLALGGFVKNFTRTICNEIYWAERAQLRLPFEQKLVTIA